MFGLKQLLIAQSWWMRKQTPTQTIIVEHLSDIKNNGRFKHLFSQEGGAAIIEEIQRQARADLEKLIERSVNSKFKKKE